MLTWSKIKRLFIIKTRFEAYVIIYALALGCFERGKAFLVAFPGNGGWLLFFLTSGAAVLAGAKILDALRYERAAAEAE